MSFVICMPFCLSALCLGPQHTTALTVNHGAKFRHRT